ncbi:MAG: transcription elongation factor GreA [Candidatus Gracilibacteria bacterium]|jgi:transcription elongation factor GreA
MPTKTTKGKKDPKIAIAESVQGAPTGETLVVTKEGFKALQEELDNLKTVRRKQVADRLREAISYGDLSENSEYEEAKNEQAFMEGRILQLEEKIKEARIVDEKAHSKQVVEIGTRVIIRNVRKKEDMEITIVGSTEADPFNARISNEAPLGTALMGAKVGDTVTVIMPVGKSEYEVVKLA